MLKCALYIEEKLTTAVKKKKKKKEEENAKRESKPHLGLEFLNIEPWYPVDESKAFVFVSFGSRAVEKSMVSAFILLKTVMGSKTWFPRTSIF